MMASFPVPLLPTMTDAPPETAANPPLADAPKHARAAKRRRGVKATVPANKAAPGAGRQSRSHPLLEQLAQLYPQLFGDVLVPLKRGIFHELQAAHPELLERDALKEALGLHTRSTRYLTVVAAGQKRHDLQGQPVEDMAPEHIYQALLEVFRRRHSRAGEDLRPKLRNRMLQAFEASGLSRQAYAQLVHCRDEAANQLLDEALAEAAARGAKDEALLRAFDASGQTVDAFADTYGMAPNMAGRMLERARRQRAATACAAAPSQPQSASPAEP